MSQMLLLLPSCVPILGLWGATLATACFGLLSSWTAQVVQHFYFRCYRRPTHQADGEIVQWDVLLSYSFKNHGALEYLGMLGLGFNLLCLLTRSIIQLTYAVSIVYFVWDKIDKRNWTFALASCCIPFALFADLIRYRMFSVLSFVTATVASLIIIIASLQHQPSQGVEHTVVSSSIPSLAWVSGTIIYALGDGSVSVETLVTIENWETRDKFKYAFWVSTACATVLSLGVAMSSYWVFGDELSKIPPAAGPCALAVLPPSCLRDIASISLLILQLIAIGQSLSPLFMYLRRIPRLLPCRQVICSILHGLARASVVGFVCMLAASIPFSGSMEITSLVGSLVISPAIYVIPAAAHMLYFHYHHTDAGMGDGALITSRIINVIQFTGVLVFIVIIGGAVNSIEKVHSHSFHRSDSGTDAINIHINGCSLFLHLLVPLLLLNLFTVP